MDQGNAEVDFTSFSCTGEFMILRKISFLVSMVSLLGCSAVKVMYDGPERPIEEVTVINRDRSVLTVRVDGNQVAF